MVQRLAGLSKVPEQLKAAQKEQQEYKTQSDELIELQKQASSLSDELGDMGAQAEALATGSARASSWRADLVAVRSNEPDFQPPAAVRTQLTRSAVPPVVLLALRDRVRDERHSRTRGRGQARRAIGGSIGAARPHSALGTATSSQTA